MTKKNIENILNQSLDNVMSDRFGRYSKYIIQERALPDARDGFKPVQRRILFSMNELGLFYNKAYKKSARVVGDVIGKYHPHGDTSIYEALVRMSQYWKMNNPLVEMHGNNGSIDDDPAAAMRYTEARLSKISNTIIDNIKKDTVLFAPNFDDSESEPTVLPGLMPNLLVNGAKGIAAGYATEMPPHNLGEVIDAIVAKIKSPNARLETLMNFIKGPDFPTGGTVQGHAGIYEAFERGKGRVVIRSKYEISNLKTKPSIRISEVPFGVVKSKLVREIDEIRFNNKIDGIKEIRDESDRNGLSILIELNSGTEVQPVLNYLLSKTEMQVYYSYNNVAIKDKAPTQMSLTDLIDAYLNHQKEVQTRAINFDLTKDKKRLEIIVGLIKVASIADQVIKTIRDSSGSKQGVIEALIKQYSFTQLQANAIAELRLYRLSRTDQSTYFEEKEILEARINENNKILSSDTEFDKHLISLLKDLKKEHATPRKTIIEQNVENIAIDMQALIKQENVWIGVSQEGYIKRFSNRAYEANKIEEYALKDGDALKYLNLISTTDHLLVFTNKGNYYMIPVHKVIETKFKDVGKHINDFALYTSSSEKIVSAIPVRDFDTNGYIILVSKEGKAKRIKIADLEVSRYNKLFKSMKLSEKDEVVKVRVSNGFQQLIIITDDGLATKYSETQIATQGPKSGGVRAIKVGTNVVKSFALINKKEVLGLVSNRGGMKRIKEENIVPMSKTTKGKNIFRSLKGNPHNILDAGPVTTKDFVIFSKKVVSLKLFNEVDITSIEEGLSLVGPTNVANAFINNVSIISKDNDFFSKNQEMSAEEKFEEAEKSIESLDQISLDDLLKDIK